MRNILKYIFNIIDITNNRSFWRTITAFFNNKSHRQNKINLLEEGETISLDEKFCEIFNDFFANIVSNIRFRIDEKYLTDCLDITDPVKACINKFEKHPSIAFIKKWIYKKPLSSGKFRKVKS